MKIKMFVMMTALAVALMANAAESRRYIVRDADHGPLPFSEAVQVGDTLYVAGHLGLDLKTQQAPQDSALEIKLLMDSFAATLKESGYTMDELTSVTIYCTDLSLYDRFNAAYKSYFHGKYPARAFIGVAKLLRGAHFELQGIAVKAARPH